MATEYRVVSKMKDLPESRATVSNEALARLWLRQLWRNDQTQYARIESRTVTEWETVKEEEHESR